MRQAKRAAILAFLAGACATIGTESPGEQNLPSSGVGPFRQLAADEVPGVAPFVLDDRTTPYGEPAALMSGTDVLLFAVARGKQPGVIVQTRALDGRAFFGTNEDSGHTPRTVLSPDQAWEGSALGGPFVLARSGGMLLYYAGSGGIGVARSPDGAVFTKEPGPILSRDPSSPWEWTELRAPAAYAGDDGKVHLFYASGVAIGEAVSDDGVRFLRAAPAPVFAPSGVAGAFDAVKVDDPDVVPRVTPAGREQVRVLYTGTADGGGTAIGFAGRYGDAGPLDRNATPVYVGGSASAPALVETPDGGALLYVEALRTVTSPSLTYAAIAAGYAPVAVHLPAPLSFPASP
jgi:hypothetical protein